MKHVVGDSEVAHLWANHIQEDARNSRNSIYFDKEIIYSYGRHFPIAAHITGKKKQKAILFTLDSYSVTTAKHIRIVRAASSHLRKIYAWKLPDITIGGKADFPDWRINDNFELWKKEAERILVYLSKAKKPGKYLSQIQEIQHQVQEFADFFGKKVPAGLKQILSVTSKEEFSGWKEKEDKRGRAAERRKVKKLLALRKEQEEKFRKFEISRVSVFTERANRAILRYNKKTKRIETSLESQIPEEIAKKFYHFILRVIEKGGCSDSECSYQVMGYDVSEINASEIRVGCHTITMEEINNLAKKLKW